MQLKRKEEEWNMDIKVKYTHFYEASEIGD